MSMLDTICATTSAEVARRQRASSLAELTALARHQTPPRGFEAALRARAVTGTALIAEIKRASPSKGLIRADFDPASHATQYETGGATCLSILTDEPYFQGSLAYLDTARAACALPCLRKDFMVDPWQVTEARAHGADAILIIVAALDDGVMAEIESAAREWRIDVLVETHDQAELERALRLRSRLIGVNNRDLRTFEVDFTRTLAVARAVPDDVLIVAESGIASHDDIVTLWQGGIRACLVGETLMRQDDLATATKVLLGG